MAKHVIKSDQTDTVAATKSNSSWLVEKGVTLSGAPALLNEGFNNVSFAIDGNVVTAGNGLASGWAADGLEANNMTAEVRANGSMTAGFIGILIEGDDGSITNRGTIEAQQTGVYFYGSGMKIENSGDIISENNAAIGSEFGVDFLIRNDGLLRSASGGSAVVIWSAQGKLINGEDGIIDGGVSLPGSSGGSVVVNKGQIAGGSDAVMLGNGNDRLINRGEIEGDIRLGDGNDLADLRKGTLTNSAVEGGKGSDTYIVDRADIEIVEVVDGAQYDSDLIKTTVSYALGDVATNEIEILFAIGKKSIDLAGNGIDNLLLGNEGDNAISGGAGEDRLNAFKGRDVLTGGADSDDFYFTRKGGVDTITDFAVGEDDLYVDHVAGIDDFGDLQDRMSSVDFDQDGDLDTVIDFGGGNRIRLTDVAKDDLQMDDFVILAA